MVCNIGHFDNEIDTAFMRKNWRWEQVKPQVHTVFRSDDSSDYLILLSEGRLVNLGNATGHPSRIMDGSFANQVLAQIHLFEQKFANMSAADKAKHLTVEVLPKQLDEEVARYMVEGFGGVITKNDPKPSRLHRRTGRRPIQARHLPLLTKRGFGPFFVPTTAVLGGFRTAHRSENGAGWLPRFNRNPFVDRSSTSLYRYGVAIHGDDIRQMGSASTLAPPACSFMRCAMPTPPASSLLRCAMRTPLACSLLRCAILMPADRSWLWRAQGELQSTQRECGRGARSENVVAMDGDAIALQGRT